MNCGDGWPAPKAAPNPPRVRDLVGVAPEAKKQMQTLLLSEPFEGSGAGYSALILAAVRECEFNPEFRKRVIEMQRTHVDTFDLHREQAAERNA